MSDESLVDLAMLLDMNHICGSMLSFLDRLLENASAPNWFEPIGKSIDRILHEVEQLVDPIETLKNVQIFLIGLKNICKSIFLN